MDPGPFDYLAPIVLLLSQRVASVLPPNYSLLHPAIGLVLSG
jgi:hypothetical protein